MTTRIMMDLETLSTDNNALILSIGACQFDAGVPLVNNRTFYRAVRQDLQESKWGRSVSKATQLWWAGQSEAARFVFVDPTAVELDRALIDFTLWLNGEVVEMWGNGADFDNVILGSAYEATHLSRPWSYGRNRCFRTLKNLGIPLAPGEGAQRGGTHHNALDDALHQSIYAAAWLRRLNTAMTTPLPLEATK
jgi:exodeoxyribonuclease VIII